MPTTNSPQDQANNLMNEAISAMKNYPIGSSSFEHAQRTALYFRKIAKGKNAVQNKNPISSVFSSGTTENLKSNNKSKIL